MTLTERFGLSGSWLSGLALALPVLLAAAFAAKFVTWPLCKFFRAINREVGLVNREPILGRDAVVLTLAVDEHYGQAEIRGAGAPILLHVRAHPGQRFQRGDIVRIEALLDDEHDIYRVER